MLRCERFIKMFPEFFLAFLIVPCWVIALHIHAVAWPIVPARLYDGTRNAGRDPIGPAYAFTMQQDDQARTDHPRLLRVPRRGIRRNLVTKFELNGLMPCASCLQDRQCYLFQRVW